MSKNGIDSVVGKTHTHQQHTHTHTHQHRQNTIDRKFKQSISTIFLFHLTAMIIIREFHFSRFIKNYIMFRPCLAIRLIVPESVKLTDKVRSV